MRNLNALVEFRRDIAGSADGLVPIERHIAIDLETPSLFLLQLLHEFCVREQRLAGNAAPVEAHAAQLVAFDDCDLVAELSRESPTYPPGPPPTTTTSK